MRRKGILVIGRWVFALVFLCALLLPGGLPRAGAQPVRVGYSASGAMLREDADGVYRGYDVLYLYEIARYTGWTSRTWPRGSSTSCRRS